MDQTPNPFPANPAPNSDNVGPLAAAVIVVVLLAAAGFYFFYSQQQKSSAEDAARAQAQSANAQDHQAATQPDSVDSIQADLNATQTTGGDADVNNLNNAL